MTPKRFIVVYVCEECGEAYDMENINVPHFWMECDNCRLKARFVSQKMIPLDFEWDHIED